jgi:hypothetical protein
MSEAMFVPLLGLHKAENPLHDAENALQPQRLASHKPAGFHPHDHMLAANQLMFYSWRSSSLSDWLLV